jgi:F-type H+-transporting ATPase subunit alpha
VGSAAQVKAMKKIAGPVKLELAQYREMAAFAQFASDLDEATRKQLERGQRVMELMKQKQYTPLDVAEMGVSLFAVENGFVDDIELEKIGAFESALHDYMKSEQSALMDKIGVEGNYDDEIETAMNSAIDNFKKNNTW